jgi:hypothetical protein
LGSHHRNQNPRIPQIQYLTLHLLQI